MLLMYFLQVKFYKSTFDPPKKEQKTKALSANIQKFLARKEEEERKKAVEAKKKKDVSYVVMYGQVKLRVYINNTQIWFLYRR